jgi:hypothetical protein
MNHHDDVLAALTGHSTTAAKRAPQPVDTPRHPDLLEELQHIPGISGEVAGTLADRYQTRRALGSATDEELLGIPGIGRVTLDRLRAGLQPVPADQVLRAAFSSKRPEAPADGFVSVKLRVDARQLVTEIARACHGLRQQDVLTLIVAAWAEANREHLETLGIDANVAPEL